MVSWLGDVYKRQLLTFVSHLQDDVAGVDVDNDEGSQCDALLFGQLAAHQGHDVLQLFLQALVVVTQSLRPALDGLMHLASPEHL